MPPIDPTRLLALAQKQCSIFNTVFNPTRARQGGKILRQRLRGPSMAAYYPRRVGTFRELMQRYPQFESYDEDEEDRLENVQM